MKKDKDFTFPDRSKGEISELNEAQHLYPNMPKWNRDNYTSFNKWGEACFEAGKKEVNDKLKEDNRILKEALETIIERLPKDNARNLLTLNKAHAALNNPF